MKKFRSIFFLIIVVILVALVFVLPVAAKSINLAAPDTVQFTPEVIGGLVAAFLALLFAYFPDLNTAYAKLASTGKSLIMIGLLLATTLVIWLLTSSGAIQTTEPITWFLAGKVFVLALIVNQSTFTVSPQTKAVKAAKLTRPA